MGETSGNFDVRIRTPARFSNYDVLCGLLSAFRSVIGMIVFKHARSVISISRDHHAKPGESTAPLGARYMERGLTAPTMDSIGIWHGGCYCGECFS